MRRLIAFLLASAAIACGGDSTPSADSTATAAPPAGSTGSSASAAAQPATGKTWDVKMIGDGTNYRFEPASITVKAGDAVRWTVVSGPPHDVAFWPDSIPSGAATQLDANMESKMSTLAGQMLNNVNDTYVISFAGVPAGAYKYYCTPHLAMGMVGSVTVQ